MHAVVPDLLVAFYNVKFHGCYFFHAEFPPNAELTLKEETLFSDGIKYTQHIYSDYLNLFVYDC
jgi:hypothetical protein